MRKPSSSPAKRSLFRKRKFRRTSTRKLSPRDLLVLDFLWTWKVASTPMLGNCAYRDRSVWWTYKALRQLQAERYIQLLPRGKNLNIELWALTDLGFEVVLMDRDDILFHRYRPHAPAHDYLATCLQLGEVWQSNVQKQFFTEQMIASLAPSNFPKGFRKIEGHVPDGITLFEGKLKRAYVGYEVDLNLKEESRYLSTFQFYQSGIEPSFIIWLVRNAWIANRILEIHRDNFSSREENRALAEKFCFVLLDEFKERVWDATIVGGKYRGTTINKIHANRTSPENR